MALVMIPSALAIPFIDKVISMEHNKDNICQDGEFPLINKECNLPWDDINNFNFFNYGWLYKLLTIGLIYLIIWNKKVLKDRNFLIFVSLAIFILIAYPQLTIEKNINKQYNLTDIASNMTPLNDTIPLNDSTTPRLIIPDSSIDKTWDNLINFPKRISERPYVGDLIFFLFILITLALLPKTLDYIEHKILGR